MLALDRHRHTLLVVNVLLYMTVVSQHRAVKSFVACSQLGLKCQPQSSKMLVIHTGRLKLRRNIRESLTNEQEKPVSTEVFYVLVSSYQCIVLPCKLHNTVCFFIVNHTI